MCLLRDGIASKLTPCLWILRSGRASGPICRGGIRRIKLAIGAFRSGNGRAASTGCCNGSPRIFAIAAKSISPKFRDPLDHTLLSTYGIEMIAANRRGRARTPTRPSSAMGSPSLEGRTLLCLAPQLPTRRHALGAPRRQLSRDGPACLRAHPAPRSCEIATPLQRLFRPSPTESGFDERASPVHRSQQGGDRGLEVFGSAKHRHGLVRLH